MLSEALVGRDLCTAAKLGIFTERVVSVASLGGGGWTWTKGIYSRLRGWETRVLRRIVGVPRHEHENTQNYLRRSAQHARRLYQGLGWTPLTTQVLL